MAIWRWSNGMVTPLKILWRKTLILYFNSIRWILANSHWLLTHSGTSYSDTAAWVGLGPKGVMERMDQVHGQNSVSTHYRRDWNKDSCTIVEAADPIQAVNCPNKKLY